MKTCSPLLGAAVVGVMTALSVRGSVRAEPAPDRKNPTVTAVVKPGTPIDSFAALRQTTSYRIVLTPHAGTDKIDQQIQQTQQRIKDAADPRAQLERLGWQFVTKARVSHDPGFYKLAEQCAQALLSVDAKSPDALLLKGHVLESLHRFKEAEEIARQLVAQRELAFDYGLLGDALVDQGKVKEAVQAYQKMVDLRPDLESYCRVAHMRWLKGDVEGAIEVALLAARAGSVQDAEPSAWACARLGSYQFQAGRLAEAEKATAAALELVKDYPAALLLRGRMLLAAGKSNEACESLKVAARINPLPEYQWALADALGAAGLTAEAEAVESELKKTGAAADPRSFALFLATRHEQTELALQLAERELENRGDVFTHDAVAWALFAAGRADEAWSHVGKALAEGTQDARLFFHAGLIARKLGRNDDARNFLLKAKALETLLLPSEHQQLDADLAALEKPAMASTGAE